jgi:hypothetical protein
LGLAAWVATGGDVSKNVGVLVEKWVEEAELGRGRKWDGREGGEWDGRAGGEWDGREGRIGMGGRD